MTRIELRQEGGAPGTGFEGHPWGAREEVRSILNVLQELTTEASLGQGASGEQHVMSRTLVWIGFFAALLEATLVIITGTVFGLQVIELAGFSTAGARGLFFSSGISSCKVDDKTRVRSQVRRAHFQLQGALFFLLQRCQNGYKSFPYESIEGKR